MKNLIILLFLIYYLFKQLNSYSKSVIISSTFSRPTDNLTKPSEIPCSTSSYRILTIKNNKNDYGLGLINIENIINKYNGSLDIEYDKNTFSVDVVLYVNKNGKNQFEYA